MTQKSDITQLPAFKEVLKDLWKSYSEEKKHSHRVQKLTVVLGESDLEDTYTKQKILSYLTGEKIITSHKLSEETKTFTWYDDIFPVHEASFIITEATCNINENRLVKLLQRYSVVPRFYIEMKNPSREVVLNNRYLITKPDYDSENHNFFEYVSKRPKQVIRIKEMEESIKKTLKKSPGGIIRDLFQDRKGFHQLEKMFFPNSSKEAVEFRNIVYQRDIENMGINEKKLKSQINNLRKWKKK